jgi:poly(hydroxyalkanoate) depolymerase family esterase
MIDKFRLLRPVWRVAQTGQLGDMAARLQARLGDSLRGLQTGPLVKQPAWPGPGAWPAPPPATPPEGMPGDRFIAGSYSNAAGTRPYKLYVPADPANSGDGAPLIVMLHGCQQNPDDFAAGTGMNQAAGRQGCLVLYPGQTRGANAGRCWNWYNPTDQQRGQGEPALIAGMVAELRRSYRIDPRRIYVAGLSAGGATAAIMADAYPDLFAACGVHSGLACGAAHDMGSALAAMHAGAAGGHTAGAMDSDRSAVRAVPLILFHGDRDSTVNPRNADELASQLLHAIPHASLHTTSLRGQVPNGHAWHSTRYENGSGEVVLERWVVEGAGHAWSGGRGAGSYTDPAGPDATAEMLRFFLAHRHPAPQA